MTRPFWGVGKRRGVPRWARYVAIAAVLIAAVTVPVVARWDPGVPQPIAFNHRKHTQDLGLDCGLCHKYVRQGAHAGLPGAETCALCHRANVSDAPEAVRVTELLAEGDPLRFNKLFRLPTHVFYTHRRHVGLGELECANCHGAIAETERPPSKPLVEITMGYCVGCHRKQGQTLNCNACHR